MLALTAILAALVALATALPFLPLAHGVARVGDFPRQQLLVLALALLAVSAFASDGGALWLAVQLAMAAVVAVQAVRILPFTPLWRRQTRRFDPEGEAGEPLRLVSSNVKMGNTRQGELGAELGRADADILILMEVDAAWAAALSGLLGRYPHVVDRAQDNSYGMIVASKFELRDVSVACLLTDGVPSVIATVVTPAGRSFRLYAIHPEPPVPHETTAGRDGETALVALQVRDETLPVVVCGDLNDVAWSDTTRRFRHISGLLDPRIGRRIFSTFDARYPLVMRWPLDHLFHSAYFRLVAMRRLEAWGSDHFPVLFDLALCAGEKADSRPAPPTADELERAADLVRRAAARKDKPIGSDWE